MVVENVPSRPFDDHLGSALSGRPWVRQSIPIAVESYFTSETKRAIIESAELYLDAMQAQ
jgi:hypothetical protein